MTKIVALLGGQELSQRELDLLLIGLVVQTESARDADAVGVDHHSAVHVEDVAHHEIGGLSADAGQGCESLDGVGDLTIVLFAQHTSHRDDILRFGLVQTAGLDVFSEFLRGALGEVGGAGVACEQLGRDQIHASVCALG